MGEVFRTQANLPRGKAGDVLSVKFIVIGIPGVRINDGPAFKQN